MLRLRNIPNLPIYPLLLAAYAVLALYANNLGQVAADVFLRSLLIALAAAAVLLLLARVVLGDWTRAALLAGLVLLAFFAYGHVYDLKKSIPALAGWMRHRYLAPLWVGALLAGIVAVWRGRPRPGLTLIFNLAVAVMLVLPLFQVAQYALSTARQNQVAARAVLPAPALTARTEQPLPSVYFILLDTYMRSDALERDMGYDNSAFVRQLEGLGFAVPECSRANHNYTQGSMVTALNMDYLDPLRAEMKAAGLDADVFYLIKHSKVRQQLESLGYRTVAFDSGYEWSRIYDADAYLGLNRDTLALQQISRFEAMLVKSTLLRVYTDYAIQSSQNGLAQANSPFAEHIELERFIFARLPELAADPAPKFVFAHLLIPHWPYVFLPDGSIRTDPDFDQDNLTSEQLIQGYTDSVAFVNREMVKVVENILAQSATPPVIVIFGDHGLRDDNRLQNFVAMYLPDGSGAVYPTITPVNYFRVVFNQVFSAAIPLLPDYSYKDADPSPVEDFYPVPDPAPQCQ